MGRVEARQSHEELNRETKEYLGRIYFGFHKNLIMLDAGGMAAGRSNAGVMNSLIAQALDYVIDDWDLQVHQEDLYDSNNLWGYWSKMEDDFATGKLKVPDFTLSPSHKSILNKAGVVLECFQVVKTPVLGDYTLAKKMLLPFMDQDQVNTDFNEIKDDPDKMIVYWRAFEDELFNLRMKRKQDRENASIASEEHLVQLDFFDEI